MKILIIFFLLFQVAFAIFLNYLGSKPVRIAPDVEISYFLNGELTETRLIPTGVWNFYQLFTAGKVEWNPQIDGKGSDFQNIEIFDNKEKTISTCPKWETRAMKKE